MMSDEPLTITVVLEPSWPMDTLRRIGALIDEFPGNGTMILRFGERTITIPGLDVGPVLEGEIEDIIEQAANG
jgi:hypothetical protein